MIKDEVGSVDHFGEAQERRFVFCMNMAWEGSKRCLRGVSGDVLREEPVGSHIYGLLV